jgi:hypothetical protein
MSLPTTLVDDQVCSQVDRPATERLQTRRHPRARQCR